MTAPYDRLGLASFAALWARIGALGFGGPAGQIALMHREVVDRARLLDEATYLRALNFCMLLPGPEAQQLATWCGWRLRGVTGGLIAGLLFVIPGALVIAALTALYIDYGELPLVAAMFDGVQAAVLAIVAQALLRIAGRALKTAEHWAVAVLAFVALFFFHLPFPLVVVAAGLWGAWRRSGDAAPLSSADGAASLLGSLRTAALWLLIWLAPVALSAVLLGADHRLTEIGAFFARMAAVTFGGAYAALAYVAQAAVADYGWLSAPEMLDGLGLAETTPGPLVLVFQFVGGMAGSRIDGWPQWAGLAAGMAMALWTTFAPSFLWIFTLAPHLDRLTRLPWLAGALASITAAVVGVMANLAAWFALHILFADVTARSVGPLRLWQPSLPFDAVAALITVAAWLLLTRAKLGLVWVVLAGAAAGGARYAWMMLAM